MYLAESDEAEVEVAGLPIGRIRPGTTIGDRSLFTGLPASATVRAPLLPVLNARIRELDARLARAEAGR
jgi:hypothetical protein